MASVTGTASGAEADSDVDYDDCTSDPPGSPASVTSGAQAHDSASKAKESTAAADCDGATAVVEPDSGARALQWARVTDALRLRVEAATIITSTAGDASAAGIPFIPGLEVDGIGPVPVPIADSGAEQLASVCEQAPFGRGTDTVVDTSFRDTWQLDAAKFRLTNPSWEAGLTEVVARVCKDMSLDNKNVAAKPYKLLLYNKGGFFKSHRDTEKADGMFGTLIIQLPSAHTGGALVVRHRGKEERHTFGVDTGAAAFKAHYAAHYADVEHELEEVTSGHRLALVYSLCWTPAGTVSSHSSESPESARQTQTPASMPGSALWVDDPTEQLASLLAELNDGNTIKLIGLDHDYTIKALAKALGGQGSSSLKGRDRVLWDALCKANAHVPEDQRWAFCLVPTDRHTTYQGYEVEEGECPGVDAKADEYGCHEDYVWCGGGADYTFGICQVLAVVDGDGELVSLTASLPMDDPSRGEQPSAFEVPPHAMARVVADTVPLDERMGSDSDRGVEEHAAAGALSTFRKLVERGRGSSDFDSWYVKDCCACYAWPEYVKVSGLEADEHKSGPVAVSDIGNGDTDFALPVLRSDVWGPEVTDDSQSRAFGNQRAELTCLYNSCMLALISPKHKDMASAHAEQLFKAMRRSSTSGDSETAVEGASTGKSTAGAAASGAGAGSELPL